MHIIDALQWRAAIKQFDPEKTVSDDQVTTLLHSLRLTASSFGLQPWHFIVVKEPTLKETLFTHSFNQSQVKDASHVIILCAKTAFSSEDVDRYLEDIVQTRGVPLDSLSGFEDVMKHFLKNRSKEAIALWVQKQIYVALGTLLTAAALQQIDTCPMEGFNPQGYDDVLGLKEKGLTATLVCPVGYRLGTDSYIVPKKVRYSLEEVVTIY
jgi:nitroreductase/dihydropteridine reductase